jgi:chromate reductase
MAHLKERILAEDNKVNLLGISGSIRAQSTNTAILRTLSERVPDTASLSSFGIGDIPPYNSDEDGEQCPAAVRSLKQAIADADGVVFCSPEYNHGTSGILKNAIDWASRPAFQSPLKNKPVLIMTSSPGLVGGVRAHQQLRDALASSLARVVVCPQVAVSNVFQKVENGRLFDEASINFALDAIGALIREIELLRYATVA